MRSTYITMITTLFYFLVFLFPIVDAKGQETICPDGTPAIITYLQRYRREPFQPDIYTTDCPSSSGASTVTEGVSTSEEALSIQTLHRRHDNACIINCVSATTCTAGSNGPTVSDCTQLSSYLSSRGQSQVVAVKQTVTASSGSCTTSFTNNVDISVTWCDSQWADQLTKLTGSCFPQSASAHCSASNIAIDVARNPSFTTTTPAQPSTTTSTTSTTTSTTRTSTTTTSTSTSTSLTTTSSTTRTNTTVGGSLLSTTSSSTSQASSSISSVEAPLVQGSTQNASSGGSSDHNGHRGINIGAVIGGVIGTILLLLLLLLLFLWWRRRSRVEKGMIPLEDEPTSKMQGPLPSSNIGRAPQLIDAEGFSPTIIIGRDTSGWDNSEKSALARRRLPALTTSGSSFVHLLSPGTFASSALDGFDSSQAEDSSAYNDPHSYMEQPSSSSHLNVAYGTVAVAGAPLLRSVSARTLARALAPHSSEDEVNRLAENIAQAAAITSPDGQIQITRGSSTPGLSELRSDAGTGVTEDPPPPWRESWNSSNHAG